MDKGKINIILLSGGSGTRLWPLSNGIRSKQFLKLLKSPDGKAESMAQRIVRQLKEAGMASNIAVATSREQYDTVVDQIGNKISDVVSEPSRRDTFPAIALAASFLRNGKGLEDSDVVIAMPIDAYTDGGYFSTIQKMAEIAWKGIADITLMGISPTQASSKFGYIVPEHKPSEGEFLRVSRFVEKPAPQAAASLISEGALWNGGVFAFRLGYLHKIFSKYVDTDSFEEMRNRYESLPKISFDYEVVEKAKSVAVVPFSGIWKDLGTWNSITEEMPSKIYGNALTDATAKNTHIVNELDIPVVCLGVENVVIAASPDGILVGTKDSSEKLKEYAEKVRLRPMFEERRWGEYKIVAYNEYPDGRKSLTKILKINDGSNISYQKHTLREEVWTCVNGFGNLVVDGKISNFRQGDVVKIGAGQMHGIMGLKNLQIVEVQLGLELSEDDIIRRDFNWEENLSQNDEPVE